MTKAHIRTIGHFIPPAEPRKGPKFCKHCGKTVSITIRNLGYCKECIKLARKDEKEVIDGTISKDG